MRLPALPICIILPLVFITSCEPWTLEKRPDHNFVTFVTTIEDNANKECWGILYDNGGYIVVGTSEETGSGNPDVYLVKVNEEGVKQWHSSLGDSDPEQGTAIIKRSDGQGYAIAGNKNVGGNDWQIYLVNTDLQGTKIGEENKYGWSQEDRAYSLIQEQNGGFLLVGYSLTWNVANLGTEAVIYQTHADGTIKEIHNHGNPVENGNDLDDFGYSIIKSADGHYILLATFEDKNYPGVFNLHLLKLYGSELSTVVWEKQLIENCHPINASMIRLDDGYAVVGASTSDKLSLIKTSLDGEKLKESLYDNCDCDKAASIFQTRDNGFLLMSSGMTLIKTDESGLELERSDFSGEVLGNRCILQSNDGGYVFAGAFDNGGKKQLKIVKMFPDLVKASPDL